MLKNCFLSEILVGHLVFLLARYSNFIQRGAFVVVCFLPEKISGPVERAGGGIDVELPIQTLTSNSDFYYIAAKLLHNEESRMKTIQ